MIDKCSRIPVRGNSEVLVRRKGVTYERKKILFIDDDESQRKIINNIIKMFGYAINTASDSGEATQILENEKYPLIITGLKMPGIDGMALCKRIRETDSESVIYALSGYAAEFKPEKIAQ